MSDNIHTVEVAGSSDIEVEHRRTLHGEIVDVTIGDWTSRLWPDERDTLVEALNADYVPPRGAVTFEVSPDGPQPVEDIESTVKGAVSLVLPLELDYVKANGERIRRTVSPAAVYDGAVPGTKIVFGFDHEREEPRQFRLDRIEGVCPAPVRFIDLETV